MRYLVLLVLLLLGAGFVFLNWDAVCSPTEVNMVFTKAQAPLGMMLLVWFGILFLVVCYGLVKQQATALTTANKMAKELEAQRKLAANAEDSRLTNVKSEFDTKWQKLVDSQTAILEASEKRIMQEQTNLLESFKEALKNNEQSNQDLSKNITTALDTMDDKITKVLIDVKQVTASSKSAPAAQTEQ